MTVIGDGPFARSGHMVRNKLCWGANNAVGLPKKTTRTSPARLYFVFKVPLRYLRPSIIYSVPCDRIVQRAYLPTMKFARCKGRTFTVVYLTRLRNKNTCNRVP